METVGAAGPRTAAGAPAEPEPSVRRLGPEDWATLRGVRLRAFDDAAAAFGGTPDDERTRDEAGWRQRLTGFPWFVLEHDGAVVAVVGGWWHDQMRADDRMLIGAWVEPAWRGRGLAGVLAEAVRDWARSEGAERLVLFVERANTDAARRWRALGFAPTGQEWPSSSGDGRVFLEHAQPTRGRGT